MAVERNPWGTPPSPHDAPRALRPALLKRGRGSQDWPRAVALTVLWLGAILWILPVLWMFSTSVKPESLVIAPVPQWLPPKVTWENYARAVTRAPLFQWIVNSALTSGLATLITLALDSMAAYAFARLRFPGRDLLFTTVLATLMVPAQVTLVPMYLLFNEAGLLNTYWAVILPHGARALGVFLLRQFMLGLPYELEDAARVDGASRYVIFTRVILPLSRPALAALAIFTFVWTWNDFTWPLISLTSQALYTLPVGLSTLVGYYARDYGMLMAGATIASLPMLVVFLLFQKQFIEGVSFTGLKG